MATIRDSPCSGPGYLRTEARDGTKAETPSTESRSRLDYYDYGMHTPVPDTALGCKLVDIERRRRHSMHVLQEHILEIKQDMNKLEVDMRMNKIAPPQDKWKHVLLAKHVDELNSNDSSDSERYPSFGSPKLYRLGNKYSVMSKQQKATMNNQSFEHLKAKHTRITDHFDDWNSDEYWKRRPQDVNPKFLSPLRRSAGGLLHRAKSRDSDNQCNCIRPAMCNLCIRFASTDVTPETLQMWQGLNSPDVVDEEIRMIMDGGRHAMVDDERCSDSVTSLPTLVRNGSPNSDIDDDHKAYSYAIDTTMRLPRICELPRGRICLASAAKGELKDKNSGQGQGQGRVHRRTITMDEVKTCRYIRGFEPKYMRMPKDITRFIFNKNTHARHAAMKKKTT